MRTRELYYDLAGSQLLDQDQRNREIELKSTGVLGVAATLVGISAVLLKDFSGASSTEKLFSELSIASYVTMVVLAIAFLVVLVSSINVIRPRDWRRDPDLKDVSNYLDSHEDAQLEEWAADQMRNSIKCNEPIIKCKAQSLFCGILGLGFLVSALFGLAISLRV